MKVTGFSFIRNATIYDYPIVEAITSVLPVCDDFVIAVGKSEDNTVDLIKSINSQKIKIIETIWDDNLRVGGKVLAQETNKAFQAIGKETDWTFYIQGDEVVHEKYMDVIYAAMKRWKDEKSVDGLLLKYLHFYGSYDYIGSSPRWYPHEARIIKNDKRIYSFRDAQGFRKGNNEKLRVKPIEAYVYHYGWVKEPKAMQKKQENFPKYWHIDQWIQENVTKAEIFNYVDTDSLMKFQGTHPSVMADRIQKQHWKFEYDISNNKLCLRYIIKQFFHNKLGIWLGYKNYIIV